MIPFFLLLKLLRYSELPFHTVTVFYPFDQKLLQHLTLLSLFLSVRNTNIIILK